MSIKGSKFAVLGGTVAVVAMLTISLAWVPVGQAQDGQDPVTRGCAQDSETLTRTSGGNYTTRRQERREIIVELRKSENCKANWVKADVPVNTLLYLKDEQGRTYNEYKTEIDGWSYGDMMNYRQKFRACAKFSDGKEVCTSLV